MNGINNTDFLAYNRSVFNIEESVVKQEKVYKDLTDIFIELNEVYEKCGKKVTDTFLAKCTELIKQHYNDEQYPYVFAHITLAILKVRSSADIDFSEAIVDE
jgi:hypothetical protein